VVSNTFDSSLWVYQLSMPCWKVVSAQCAMVNIGEIVVIWALERASSIGYRAPRRRAIRQSNIIAYKYKYKRVITVSKCYKKF